MARAGVRPAVSDAAHFDRIYAASADPWGYETSTYEAGKYAATLDALPRRRWRDALEVGCSIGVLTLQLAAICDRLTAIDGAARALERCRARLAPHPHVDVRHGRVPADWPDQKYDLIVLSELIYYLPEPDMHAVARLTADALTPDGHAILVNHTGKTDTPLTGAEAEALFVATAGLPVVTRLARPGFRLALLRRD